MYKSFFLPAFSLRRPVTVLMLFICLIGLGLVGYSRIRVTFQPEGQENHRLSVRVEYIYSSPAEVADVISMPLERMLRTMPGVESLRTYSHHSGCWAGLEFSADTDMDEVYNQLRERLEHLRAELPDEAQAPRIFKWSSDDMPVMNINFRVEGKRSNLYETLDRHLKAPLEALDGVGQVEINEVERGYAEIALRRDRMNAHGVDVKALTRQLQSDNFSMSSGKARDGSQSLFVRSQSQFTSMDVLKNLPVTDHPGLKLSDVAEISHRYPTQRQFWRVEGYSGVYINVTKEAGANTIEVSRRVRAALKNDILKRPQMKGIAAYVAYDLAEHVQSSMNTLRNTGLWGGLFAVLVLFYFLRRTSTTLLVASAIPVSILFSMWIVYMSGWTLNLVTMLGLMIAVGMVVDNAVVVVEAIHARHLAGENPHESSLQGASEVGRAILVSTLTTIVVFLPLIFMSGSEGFAFAMARIGMPVTYALLGSLVVALLFIPLSMKRIVGTESPPEPRLVSGTNRLYGRGLRWAMDHRLETAIIVLVLLFSITIPLDKVSMNMSGRGGTLLPRAQVRFGMPAHYSLARIDSIASVYEQFMFARKEEYGLERVQVQGRRSSWGTECRVWAYLPKDERQWYTVAWHKLTNALGYPQYAPKTRKELFDEFRKYAPTYAGVPISLDYKSDWRQKNRVSFSGPDTRKLIKYAEEAKRRLMLIPGIASVESDLERGDQELRLSIDRKAVQHYDLSARTIATTVSNAISGARLKPLRIGDREIQLRMNLHEKDRQTLDQVLNLEVALSEGGSVRLASLVNVTGGRGLRSIEREDGVTMVDVEVYTEEDVKNLAKLVSQSMNEMALPPGYRWTLTGRFAEMKEGNLSMTFAIIMSVVCVFLLMGFLFESFILPLSVIAAIPFSFLGAFWLHHWTGMTMNMFGGMGLVVLIGVVVNNAIVLVDLINQLRQAGYDRLEAIYLAGNQRFRPIVMTSATTVLGLFPLAVGNANMVGLTYGSLGVTMIGGLISSTIFTLFVVPLFYSLLDDLRMTTGKLVGVMMGEKTKG
jgi:hydrophobic/amphiphilic exporter-1 (mainly G- bacteria), HAE1 family